MPRVSIIVPNYNHEPFLKERIDTILDQTFQDFELILLDDCSTDESRIILEQYRNHPKVSHIVFNEKNSGSAFKQWDKGIELATGELIWIAESDDFSDNLFLERLVPVFDNDSKCVLAFCYALTTDIDGVPIGIHPYHRELGSYSGGDGWSFIRHYLNKHNYVVNASGALFKRHSYYNLPDFVNPAFKEFKGVGDWLFWIGIASQGSVGILHQGMNYFRQHGTNTTSVLYHSGVGFKESAELFSILKDHKVISYMRWLNIRASNTAALKYKSLGFDNTTISEYLDIWKSSSPIISLWAWLKHVIHRKRY